MKGEVFRQLKIFIPPPPHLHATDRFNAVVPVLFLFFAALWFILRSASCFKVFPCSLSSCFVIPLRIVITSLGEEEDGLCASRAFVCLFCTCWFLSFFSSCSCRGLAAFCDCGTPWTFLLTFLPTLVLYMSQAMRKCVLCHMRTTKAQINLRIRAV